MPRSRRLSDATLVRRSQQGDRRAFTALLTRYDWRLRGLAHALLLDPGEMDVALGVGYLRAWRDVVRISPSDNVAAWLYRVVYNACIDQLRRADGTASPAAPAPPAGGVATGLASLPAAERVVVVLVDREGFSPSSAARIMGLSPDAVTETLQRARATLAEHVPAAPPSAGAPDRPAADAVPAPAAAPQPVGRDAEAAGSAAAAGAAAADGASVGGGGPVAGPPGGADPAAVDPSPAGPDPAVVVGSPAAGGNLAETGEAEDAEGFEDHGPIDHEAVADAVVTEAAADGDADADADERESSRAPEANGDAAGAAGSDGAPATPQESGAPQDESRESDAAPGDGLESDGASGNGNGAAGRNGHAANSGRGRRSRRRAKHAAAQQRPDGTGPAGDGTA